MENFLAKKQKNKQRKQPYRKVRDKLYGTCVEHNIPEKMNVSLQEGMKVHAQNGFVKRPSTLGEGSGDGLFTTIARRDALPEGWQDADDIEFDWAASLLFPVFGKFKRHLTEEDQRGGRY